MAQNLAISHVTTNENITPSHSILAQFPHVKSFTDFEPILHVTVAYRAHVTELLPVCNHQTDNPLYPWPDVCSGDL